MTEQGTNIDRLPPKPCCRQVVDFLCAYLDGELSADERREFDEHLAICPPCVAYLATYRASITAARASMLETKVGTPPPPSLVEAVMKSLRRRDNAG